MKTRLLAKRYAKAFVYNADDDITENLMVDQENIKKLFRDSPETLDLLKSNLVSRKVKADFMNIIINRVENRQLWDGLFETLLQKKRESLINAVIDEIGRMLLVRLDKIRMTLYLAREHKKETVAKMKKRFEALLSKEIIIDVEIDSSIIGGFVAIVGNTRIDGSIKHSLERFRKLELYGSGSR